MEGGYVSAGQVGLVHDICQHQKLLVGGREVSGYMVNEFPSYWIRGISMDTPCALYPGAPFPWPPNKATKECLWRDTYQKARASGQVSKECSLDEVHVNGSVPARFK